MTFLCERQCLGNRPEASEHPCETFAESVDCHGAWADCRLLSPTDKPVSGQRIKGRGEDIQQGVLIPTKEVCMSVFNWYKLLLPVKVNQPQMALRPKKKKIVAMHFNILTNNLVTRAIWHFRRPVFGRKTEKVHECWWVKAIRSHNKNEEKRIYSPRWYTHLS